MSIMVNILSGVVSPTLIALEKTNKDMLYIDLMFSEKLQIMLQKQQIHFTQAVRPDITPL